MVPMWRTGTSTCHGLMSSTGSKPAARIRSLERTKSQTDPLHAMSRTPANHSESSEIGDLDVPRLDELDRVEARGQDQVARADEIPDRPVARHVEDAREPLGIFRDRGPRRATA